MTSEARHSSRTSKLSVCVAHELNHLASGLLRRPVVFLELVFDVAISAIDSQRSLKREHDFHQAVRRNAFEELNVLVLLLGAFFFTSRR